MSQRIYPINHMPPVIDIGKQTEQGVTRIGFDMHEWLDDWPGMKFSVRPVRPGEVECYDAKTDQVGDVLYWMIGAKDTEKAGSGMLEVLGVTEDERKLSAMCRTSIANTNTTATGEIPVPDRPWVDQVILAGETAKADAKDARQAAQEAAQARNEASAAAQEAGQYSANADSKAAAAAVSAESADLAKAVAVSSVGEAAANAQVAADKARAAETSANTANNKASEADGYAKDAKDAMTKAEASAKEAKADATAAAASADAAGQHYSAVATEVTKATNAADSANKSAQASAQSASAAESSKSAAASYATVANTSAGNAQTAAATATSKANEATTAANNAAASAQSADKAASDAAQSAKEAAKNMLIVRQNRDASTDKTYATHSIAEIRAALLAGKSVFLVNGVRPLPCVGPTNDGGYRFQIFSWDENGEADGRKGLFTHWSVIKSDGEIVTDVRFPITTPNPYKLKLKGAVTAEYDGSKEVAVTIPAGGGGSVDLTTDADGNAVAINNTPIADTSARAEIEALKMNGGGSGGSGVTSVTILPETELVYTEDMGMPAFAGEVHVMPKSYTLFRVNYNGTIYDSIAIWQSNAFLFGNHPMLDDMDNGIPFLGMIMPVDENNSILYFISLDGSSTVNLSITQMESQNPGVFVVNLTCDNETDSERYYLNATKDKTYAEMETAYALGNVVVCRLHVGDMGFRQEFAMDGYGHGMEMGFANRSIGAPTYISINFDDNILIN